MYRHSGDFIRFLRNNCCGFRQHTEDRRHKKENKVSFAALFIALWPFYHSRNVTPSTFPSILILNVINRFTFGHGVVIYYYSDTILEGKGTTQETCNSDVAWSIRYTTISRFFIIYSNVCQWQSLMESITNRCHLSSCYYQLVRRSTVRSTTLDMRPA